MMAQRRRLCASVKTALVQSLVFAGKFMLVRIILLCDILSLKILTKDKTTI